MIRSLDPQPFNRIFNDPGIRPLMGHGTEPQDLSVVVRNPANYCFLTQCGEGGYICARLKKGLYVAHTLALAPARGRPMLRLMREGFEYLFTATDCVEVVTTCPDGNEAASRWADAAGFRETFRREAFFPLGGKIVGASFRSLSYGEWVLRHAPNRARGQAFHEQLHAASLDLALHAEDPVHDAWVGATILGCRAGNIKKSVKLFNRWAAQAGYMQSAVLSCKPPVIWTGDAVLGLTGDEVEILQTKVCDPAPDKLS